jgi:hypothetical protein
MEHEAGAFKMKQYVACKRAADNRWLQFLHENDDRVLKN